MFPSWRRTKSLNVHSGGEKNTVISSQLEKLVSKPHSPSEDNLNNSKPVIRTSSPTKRAQSISPIRTKASPYNPTRERQNRKLRSQTGPPSIPSAHVPGGVEVSTSGPLPFRTQSDLPHLSQALQTPHPPNPTIPQVQSISSSSGILSSGSIFSAYGDSTSSVATSGSEQVSSGPMHSDLDQAIHQYGTRSPQPRPTNLSTSSNRKNPTSRIPSPHRTHHPELTPKSPHKLHLFWGPQQPGTISYNEKFTRPMTETVDGFTDPSLVTVPSECLNNIQVDSPVKGVPTKMKKTTSIDSLASSTVNFITSITEEMQDLLGTSASSATSVGNKSDSCHEVDLVQNQNVTSVPNNQSFGSVNRVLETRYSYLEDDNQGPNSTPASPLTPQNIATNEGDLPPIRSRAYSTPTERIYTLQRTQQNMPIYDDFNKERFLHTSNIIPVSLTLSTPYSPLIPPAHKFPLRRLHSLNSKIENQTATLVDPPELRHRRHLEGLVEADTSLDFSEHLTLMGSIKQNKTSLEFNSKKLVRKSSSFSSISSEILADESLNSDFILPQLMSERREKSYDQLDILDSPIRKNIAAKTELKKYVVMNLFDTEMSYVRSLETIIKENGDRLTTQIQIHNPMLLSTLESLLSHLTHMFKKHKSFLVRIENAYKNYDQTTTIGGIIWHHFSQPELLETYLNYIQCYQALIDTLRYAATKTSNRQKKNPNPKDPFEKLTLADLLIQPIQRPLRYPLIIKDLVKQSIPGSSEHQQLANALLQVGDFTMKMNACLQTDVPSGPEVLKELEIMIDGLENLMKPNRLLLRLGGDFVTETKPPMYYMNPRRDKCIFLFSDLILLCNSRPKSATLGRASSFGSGDSTLDLAKRKLKLMWETPIQRVAIETNESIVEREKTKADKQVEKLLEDEKRLSEMLAQMQSLHYGNNGLEKVITESLHQLHAQIYEKRLKLPSYNACLTLIDLELSEKRIIVFADEQTKLDWVKAYKDARGKLECEQQELSWMFDRKDLTIFPQFLKPLMLMESRSGMEATCACQVQTTSPDVTTLWVCRSDKFVGQVVELSSQKGSLPNVNASYTVSPSPIMCITSVPDMNASLPSDNEGTQENLLVTRPRSYSSKTFSEKRNIQYRHARHSSTVNSYSGSMTDGANISKCSSASNLSDHNTNREYHADSDRFNSSISPPQSQWNDSPLYVENCSGAGDLITMVSGSANSLISTSEYEPSLLSLLGECGKFNKKFLSPPIKDSMMNSSKEDSMHLSPLMERTNEELNTESGRDSTILPESDSSRSATFPELFAGANNEISKHNNPEVTDLGRYLLDSDQPNNVQKLINRFSPEKIPPNINVELDDIGNTNVTPLLDNLTGEEHTLKPQIKTKFPTYLELNLAGKSPDMSHCRENSRDLNRLWLQTSFNKSNPHLPVGSEPQERVEFSKFSKNNDDGTTSMPSTPTISDKMENAPKCESEKKSKLEKKSSLTKFQMPKLFTHKPHRSSILKTSLKLLDEDNEERTSPSSNLGTPCSDANLSRNGSQDILSAPSKDSLHICGPTVWLGTESGGLIVYQSDVNIRTQSRHTIQLSHSVHTICHHRNKVFVGIGNGNLVIFSYTKASQEWIQSEKRQVSNIDHPLLCITSVQQETLWVAEANRVHIFAGDVFSFSVKKFSLWPTQRNNSLIVINQIVYDGNEGVWVCLDREPTLHLYSILTYTQVLQVDCMGPCLKLIQDKILYKHMSDQFRITSVHAASQGTWVGISSGILAFITSPKYDARACQVIEDPTIYPSFHGHTAGIKFIVPWKHRFLESKRHEIIVTGGIGYEYRGDGKYPVEFERDSQNSGTVLIWNPQ